MLNELTDDELMEQLLKGQTSTLAELFRRYKNELFGFYYRQTNKSDLSEDLVQNVFIRIIKYHHSYNKRGTFRSWLYQIARNVQLDFSRTNQQRFQESFVEMNDHHIGTKSDLLDYDYDQLNILNQAFQTLETEKKELVILHRFQKLSYKEIADLMNSNEGAIKVKMFRIIKELREIYKRIEGEL